MQGYRTTGTHSLHSGPGVGELRLSMLASVLGCVDVSAVVVVDVAVSSGADSMVPLCSGRGEGSFLFVEDPWLSAGSCESLCFVVGVDVSVSSLKVLLVFV